MTGPGMAVAKRFAGSWRSDAGGTPAVHCLRSEFEEKVEGDHGGQDVWGPCCEERVQDFQIAERFC